MPLINIPYASEAHSDDLNNNFEYLNERINDTNEKVDTKDSQLATKIENAINTSITSGSINSSIKNLIEQIYPVGAIYIGTTSTCPIASIVGAWQLVSAGRVLQGADAIHAPNTTIEAGLPEIAGYIGSLSDRTVGSGAFNVYQDTGAGGGLGGGNGMHGAYFNASRYNPIYGRNSTVQPPAYIVNVWRRIG